MALSQAVEYILSLRRQDMGTRPGQQVCYAGGQQVRIPVFPGNTTLPLALYPRGYMFIVYSAAFGPRMLPGAFYSWMQPYGGITYTAVLDSRLLADSVDFFLVITQNGPWTGGITNLTGLNQYFEEVIQYIDIYAEEDFDIIVRALENRATSAKEEENTRQCAEALELLVEASGQKLGQKYRRPFYLGGQHG